jgi:hypothetical protein
VNIFFIDFAACDLLLQLNMKTFFCVLLFSMFSYSAQAAQKRINLHFEEIGGLNPNDVARGYYLGSVTRAANQGALWNTFEATFLIGAHSPVGIIYDNNCLHDILKTHDRKAKCEIGLNPWTFSSFNTNYKNYFERYPGLILLRYVQRHFSPVLESHNIIREAFTVDSTIKLPQTKMEVPDLIVSYSTGYINGRVVRASLEGVARRTYELIIQGGDGGDHFYHMSVVHKNLFKFTVKAMLTGRPLRIHYERLYSAQAAIRRALGYDTNYRVIGVQVL